MLPKYDSFSLEDLHVLHIHLKVKGFL